MGKQQLARVGYRTRIGPARSRGPVTPFGQAQLLFGIGISLFGLLPCPSARNRQPLSNKTLRPMQAVANPV